MINLAPDDERRHTKRRQETCDPKSCEHIIDVQAQVEAVKVQIEASAQEIARIRAMLDANNEATAELLEIIKMGKGFFKALGWIGRVVRAIILWVAPIVTALIGLWYTIKQGK